MEFLRHTLANGLEIVAEGNPAAHSTAMGFFVSTGSRDESDELAGVSHFLEHMAFKGTPTRSADDVNREFDEMGAHYNASTGEEFTRYYAAVLPEQQDRAVALLADILRPTLREKDFETEKQVILEEIQMYEDHPPFGADDKCKAAHFGKHPLGRSVLGTAESIRGLPVEAMREYFRRRYSPANITLIAAGRVDFEALVRSADRFCSHWERFEPRRELLPATGHEGFQSVHKSSATQQYAVQLSDGPSARDEERYPAKLLATVLGDDTGSRLYWELVDSGRAEQASLAHYDYQDAGLFMTYMSCDPDDAADNLRLIADIYRRAEGDGVGADELAQAQSKLRSRIVLSGERPWGRLFSVAGHWLQRREYRSVRDDLDTVAAITRDQIAEVLREYPLTRTTTLTIGPLPDVAEPK